MPAEFIIDAIVNVKDVRVKGKAVRDRLKRLAQSIDQGATPFTGKPRIQDSPVGRRETAKTFRQLEISSKQTTKKLQKNFKTIRTDFASLTRELQNLTGKRITGRAPVIIGQFRTELVKIRSLLPDVQAALTSALLDPTSKSAKELIALEGKLRSFLGQAGAAEKVIADPALREQNRKSAANKQIAEIRNNEKIGRQLNVRVRKLLEEQKILKTFTELTGRRSANERTSNQIRQSLQREFAPKKGEATGQTVKRLAEASRVATERIRGLTNAVKQVQATQRNYDNFLKQHTFNIKAFGDQSALAIKRYAAYLVPTTGLFAIIFAVKRSIEEFKAFEKIQTNLQQILGLSQASVKGLGKDLLDLAKQTGLSLEEIGRGAKIFAQAGLGRDRPGQALGSGKQDLIVATTAVVRAQLGPTFEGVDSTIEGLIAIFNQFGLELEDTNRILDITNQLSKDFAIEAGNFFTAVSKGGSVFATLGGSFEDFAGLLALLRSETRESASQLGTFFKTAGIRLFREDAEDELRALNESILLTTNFGDRLRALAPVFATLGSQAQIRLAPRLVGLRQANRLIALLSALTARGNELNISLSKSLGSVDRDFALRVDDIAISFQKLRKAFDAFIIRVIESPVIITSLNLIATGFQGIFNILEKLAPLVGGLLGVGGLVALRNVPGFFSGVKGRLFGAGGAGGSATAGLATSPLTAATNANTIATKLLITALNTNTGAVSTNSRANIAGAGGGGGAILPLNRGRLARAQGLRRSRRLRRIGLAGLIGIGVAGFSANLINPINEPEEIVKQKSTVVGRGIASGAGVGGVLGAGLAARTLNPYIIAIGALIGATVGAARALTKVSEATTSFNKSLRQRVLEGGNIPDLPGATQFAEFTRIINRGIDVELFDLDFGATAIREFWRGAGRVRSLFGGQSSVTRTLEDLAPRTSRSFLLDPPKGIFTTKESLELITAIGIGIRRTEAAVAVPRPLLDKAGEPLFDKEGKPLLSKGDVRLFDITPKNVLDFLDPRPDDLKEGQQRLTPVADRFLELVGGDATKIDKVFTQLFAGVGDSLDEGLSFVQGRMKILTKRLGVTSQSAFDQVFEEFRDSIAQDTDLDFDKSKVATTELFKAMGVLNVETGALNESLVQAITTFDIFNSRITVAKAILLTLGGEFKRQFEILSDALKRSFTSASDLQNILSGTFVPQQFLDKSKLDRIATAPAELTRIGLDPEDSGIKKFLDLLRNQDAAKLFSDQLITAFESTKGETEKVIGVLNEFVENLTTLGVVTDDTGTKLSKVDFAKFVSGVFSAFFELTDEASKKGLEIGKELTKAISGQGVGPNNLIVDPRKLVANSKFAAQDIAKQFSEDLGGAVASEGLKEIADLTVNQLNTLLKDQIGLIKLINNLEQQTVKIREDQVDIIRNSLTRIKNVNAVLANANPFELFLSNIDDSISFASEKVPDASSIGNIIESLNEAFKQTTEILAIASPDNQQVTAQVAASIALSKSQFDVAKAINDTTKASLALKKAQTDLVSKFQEVRKTQAAAGASFLGLTQKEGGKNVGIFNKFQAGLQSIFARGKPDFNNADALKNFSEKALGLFSNEQIGIIQQTLRDFPNTILRGTGGVTTDAILDALERGAGELRRAELDLPVGQAKLDDLRSRIDSVGGLILQAEETLTELTNKSIGLLESVSDLAKNSIIRLADAINDIPKIIRIEAGPLEINVNFINLASLASVVTEGVRVAVLTEVKESVGKAFDRIIGGDAGTIAGDSFNA